MGLRTSLGIVVCCYLYLLVEHSLKLTMFALKNDISNSL